MNKVIIFYFSGTGNTKIISEMLKSRFEDLLFHVDLYDIRKPLASIPDLSSYQHIGFGYPVHAFNTPQFFLNFIENLPKVDHIPTFIFKTSGEPFFLNNVSSYSLIRKLKRKGYTIDLEGHFLMPYHIMFRYPDEIAKTMYLHNTRLTKVFVKQILSGHHELPKFYPWLVLWMYLSRIEWFGAKINGPMIHVDKDVCTNCNLCIENCPSENIIKSRGFPKFGYDCTLCMSCASICPVDAIKFGLLDGWKVNGGYPFKKYARDDTLPEVTIDKHTKGYFKWFHKYYEKSGQKIEKWLENEDK